MRGLFTIGYEGADIDDFVATLSVMGVDVLLDIRELPISRRRGFAKRALSEAVGEVGIGYRHEKQLGSPKPIRDELKKGGDYDRFFRAYTEHLDGHRDLLEQLANDLCGNVALLCYERNHNECHRSVVADALAQMTGCKPVHLGVQGHEQRENYKKARMGAG